MRAPQLGGLDRDGVADVGHDVVLGRRGEQGGEGREVGGRGEAVVGAGEEQGRAGDLRGEHRGVPGRGLVVAEGLLEQGADAGVAVAVLDGLDHRGEHGLVLLQVGGAEGVGEAQPAEGLEVAGGQGGPPGPHDDPAERAAAGADAGDDQPAHAGRPGRGDRQGDPRPEREAAQVDPRQVQGVHQRHEVVDVARWADVDERQLGLALAAGLVGDDLAVLRERPQLAAPARQGLRHAAQEDQRRARARLGERAPTVDADATRGLAGVGDGDELGHRAGRVPRGAGLVVRRRPPYEGQMTEDGTDRAALERRVVDLEVQVAFQARTIEELDEVVRQFAGRVEAMQRDLRALQALAPANAGDADARELLMAEAAHEEAEP